VKPQRPESEIDWLTDFLIRHRWLLVVPVLLPLSFVFELLMSVRDFYMRTLQHAPKKHEARVRDIQEQIRRWHENGSKGRLCTARPPWMSISTRMVKYKRPENSIHIALYDILSLDVERRVVRVEPRVTVGQLTAYLVPRGWTLPVVPERCTWTDIQGRRLQRDGVRRMEQFLLEHRGYQALYSVTQMSADEFRRMFDCTLYDQVRDRYGLEDVFMDVYENVRLT